MVEGLPTPVSQSETENTPIAEERTQSPSATRRSTRASSNASSIVPPASPLIRNSASSPSADRATSPVAAIPVVDEPRGAKRKHASETALTDQASSTIENAGAKPSTSRKKRKAAAPHPSPGHLLAGSRRSAPASDSSLGAVADAEVASQSQVSEPTTTTLLENAAASAAQVSQLANSIESRLNSSDNRDSSASQERGVNGVIANSRKGASSRKSKRSSSRRTIEEAVADIVAAAVGDDDTDSGQRKRNATPAEAEEHQRDVTGTTMGELCKDDRLGRKSTRENDMQTLGRSAIKQSWKEQAERARESQNSRSKKLLTDTAPEESVVALIPTMMINKEGQIVMNQDSTEIDPHQGLEEVARNAEDVIEDRVITRRTNQSTIGKRKGLSGISARWSEESTDMFYKGIRMFGTDMMMIASIFPGLTRRHIKLKYVKEERTNFARLQRNLAMKDPIDLAWIGGQTEKDYIEDPGEFLAGLEAEKVKAEADEKDRLARIDAGDAGDVDEDTVLPSLEDDPQPSTEVDEQIAEPTRTTTTEPPRSENRFDSITSAIIRQAAAPRRKRKLAAPVRKTKKKESMKRGARPVEGVEERLGTVEEVGR